MICVCGMRRVRRCRLGLRIIRAEDGRSSHIKGSRYIAFDTVVLISLYLLSVITVLLESVAAEICDGVTHLVASVCCFEVYTWN
jgi:hypothetical protein